jgi:hypothetical protein
MNLCGIHWNLKKMCSKTKAQPIRNEKKGQSSEGMTQNELAGEAHQTVAPRLGRRYDSLGLRRRLHHGLRLTLDLLGRYVRLLPSGRGRLELLLELLLQLLLDLLLQGRLRRSASLGGTGGRRRSGGRRFGTVLHRVWNVAHFLFL